MGCILLGMELTGLAGCETAVAGDASGVGPEVVLRERVLEAAGKASGDVKLAVSLAESFPATLEALASGEVNAGQAV